MDQVVLIGMSTGGGRRIGPDRAEGTHHFAIYLPGADADGDGILEGEPFVTFEATSVDTRLRVSFYRFWQTQLCIGRARRGLDGATDELLTAHTREQT